MPHAHPTPEQHLVPGPAWHMTRAHKPDVPLENAAGIVHYPEVLDRIGAFY
jgi:hypothetical protein